MQALILWIILPFAAHTNTLINLSYRTDSGRGSLYMVTHKHAYKYNSKYKANNINANVLVVTTQSQEIIKYSKFEVEVDSDRCSWVWAPKKRLIGLYLTNSINVFSGNLYNE